MKRRYSRCANPTMGRPRRDAPTTTFQEDTNRLVSALAEYIDLPSLFIADGNTPGALPVKNGESGAGVKPPHRRQALPSHHTPAASTSACRHDSRLVTICYALWPKSNGEALVSLKPPAITEQHRQLAAVVMSSHKVGLAIAIHVAITTNHG